MLAAAADVAAVAAAAAAAVAADAGAAAAAAVAAAAAAATAACAAVGACALAAAAAIPMRCCQCQFTTCESSTAMHWQWLCACHAIHKERVVLPLSEAGLPRSSSDCLDTVAMCWNPPARSPDCTADFILGS